MVILLQLNEECDRDLPLTPVSVGSLQFLLDAIFEERRHLFEGSEKKGKESREVTLNKDESEREKLCGLAKVQDEISEAS